MLDDIVRLGCCYYQLGNYLDARYTLTFALKLVELVCENEDVKPTLHCRELGDIYALLAKVYLKEGKTDEALNSLKMMVNHDVFERCKYKNGMNMNTPLLRDTDNFYYSVCPDIKRRLIDILNGPDFDEIRECDEFNKILRIIRNSNI